MTMAGTGACTASQAWAILKRHAKDEIAPLRLQELCRDNDRVSSLVTVHKSVDDSRMLLVDLSRQRMTLETLNHLLRLAAARKIKKYITKLAWGQNDPDNPVAPSRVNHGISNHHNVNHDGKKARFEEADEGGGRRRNSFQASGPMMPTMHLALRAPEGSEMLDIDGNNVIQAIHREWDRLQRLSDSLRRGQLRGVTGNMIRDIVIVGKGVPVMALRFVYEALLKDESAMMARKAGLSESSGRMRRVGGGVGPVHGFRRMKFLTSVDPIAASSIVADLDPASTMVISIALKGNEETGLATRTMKTWLLQALSSNRRSDLVMGKHMYLVTGNERIAAANRPETVFLIPEHSRCEPFATFTSAALLPLSIVFGWPIVQDFIAGAHNIDSHFVETNPRHNLPVLLALTDIWNDALFGSPGRIVLPYTEAFRAFPSYVAALEAQTCSGKTLSEGSSASVGSKLTCSTMVVDGGLHSTYDRAMYQAGSVAPSEFTMVLDTQVTANTARTIGVHGMDDVNVTQDALVCSFFAHVDEMAFGSNDENRPPEPYLLTPMSATSSDTLLTSTTVTAETEISEGNRPSTLLICDRLDAFSCGQLIAVTEHRAVVKARVWDINPFVREVGSSLRSSRIERLKEDLHKMFTFTERSDDEGEEEEGDEEKSMNLSTKTILGHYASMMRDQRIYVVKGS